MIHRVALVLGLLSVAGCCCPQDRASKGCDPLREIGVDCRGLVGHGPGGPADRREMFLDMTVARVPEGQVEQVLGAYRPQHAGEPTAISAPRAEALLAAWRQNPAVQITSSPKLLALPGQEASVFIGEIVRVGETVAPRPEDIVVGGTPDGETLRYRRTAAATNAAGGLEFSIEEDPLGTVSLGMEIRILATPSPDGRRVSLEVTGSWRELMQDLSPETMAAMTRGELEAQVREHRLDTRFRVPNDGWMVLGNPSWIETDAGRVQQVLLLHALVIDGGR